MATNTTNEGLVKPDGGDLYDIAVFNDTLDKLDAKITELRQTISSALSNKDGSITGSKLADNTIPSSKYATGSVNSNALADGSVTTPKIANDAVTCDKIAADAIGNEQLAQNAVAAENIVDGIVGTAKLADGSVTSSKLANNSVTSEKLGIDIIELLMNVDMKDDLLYFSGTYTAGVEVKAVDKLMVSDYGEVLAIKPNGPVNIGGVKATSIRKELVISASGNYYNIYAILDQTNTVQGTGTYVRYVVYYRK